MPEDFLLCNTGMMSQTQAETSLFPQVYVPSPDVGLVASKVTPDITDGPREGPFDAHHDRHLHLHGCCRRLRVACFA